MNDEPLREFLRLRPGVSSARNGDGHLRLCAGSTTSRSAGSSRRGTRCSAAWRPSWCRPTAPGRVSSAVSAFLTGSPHTRELGDMALPGAFAGDDLRDNALEAVGRYLDAGLDVIVVDQTTPEHRASGLACVKVLIPGTLSMTFGHRHRRVEDIPRLRTVPRLLGHRDDDLPPEAVNPHPHPLP